MRFLWLSANRFGYSLLKETVGLEGIEVGPVFTLGPQAKTKMYDGVERAAWDEFQIPVCEIEDVNEEGEKIKSYSPDFIVACGWRQKISREILDIPKKGIIGFHPTLLPKGRGSAPIINTILEGINDSGVTMFYMDEGLDSGDIIGQEDFLVEAGDYAGDVYEKAIIAGRRLVKKYLPLLAQDRAPRIEQDNKQATYFGKRTLKDNRIDLDSDSPECITRKIRAFSAPYLGAYIKNGSRKLTIWKAELENENR